MSIERDKDRFGTVIECDLTGCGAEFIIADGIPFEYGWKAAKEQGWRTRRIGSEWVHGCPKHAREVCLDR